MPEWLKRKLQEQYPNNPNAVWGTLNRIGAVKGNVETAKGRAMEKKHVADQKKKKKR